MELPYNPQATLAALAHEHGWDLPEDLHPRLYKALGKPLRRLQPAELLALVEQGVALPAVAPLAIEKLEADPMLQANRHPGDLMTALLEADTRYWQEHFDAWAEMVGVAAVAVNRVNEAMQEQGTSDYLPFHLGDDFMGALLHFREIHRAPGAPPEREGEAG